LKVTEGLKTKKNQRTLTLGKADSSGKNVQEKREPD